MIVSADVSLASPIFQNNYAVKFGRCLFYIDKKVSKIIRIIFDDALPAYFSETGIGSDMLCEIKATSLLSEPVFENILHFFLKGELSDSAEGKIKSLDKAGSHFNFNLMRNYLYHTLQSTVNDPFDDDSYLSPFDKLELAAIQQKPLIFCRLLERYFKEVQERGLQKETIKEGTATLSGVEELVNQTDDIPFFDEIMISQTLTECPLSDQPTTHSKESGLSPYELSGISKLLVHFQPRSFEQVICSCISSESPSLYEEAVKTYAEFYSYCLDDVIYQITDSQLKWTLITYIPHLDARIIWFKQFKKEAPAKYVKTSLVAPLIAYGRYEEALKWAELVQDFDSCALIKEKRLKRKEYKSTFLQPLELQVGNLSLNLKEKDLEFKEIPSIHAMRYCPHWQTPIEFIQEQIRDQICRINCTIDALDVSDLSKSFMPLVEEQLLTHAEEGWTRELIVFAVQCYIQESLVFLAPLALNMLEASHCPLTSYDKQLHPALMEDLNFIKKMLRCIRFGLLEHFGASDSIKILQDKADILSEKHIADTLISCARRLYQQKFSLREDLIVQSVSDYLQTYFYAYEYGTESLVPVEPFIEKLEKKIQSAGLGKELTAEEIILARNIYIRKSIEIFNHKHFPLGNDKLNPYHPGMEGDYPHVKVLRKIKDALEFAFERDFSKKHLSLLTKDQAKVFSGPDLLQLVFVEALKAYHRTCPAEPVKYKKFVPSEHRL